ncbi:uncharacterized protein LOC121379416 [Gigantopelta aegis]|uniref:uncharacterized protein LOC121379416 n=1 Tax=Gigantopelta aegis TaxID=1735272 RepID=UPI001B88AFA0|nr:uncharacterized protein LOC121379416 [Gigantopelta aegis]XP_041363962.1 uncharacterized protein LOC121379416 [Gigantopelta aegis]
MASHTENWKLMATMYSTPSKNSDVLIVVDGRKLYFYKQLLCLVSPVFKSMLCSDFKEKKTQTINLEGKRFTDIVLLLAWIDPAVTFKIDEYRANTLLPLADEYDITNLRQTCEQVLCVCLAKGSLNVVIRYLQLAEQFNLKNLIEKALTRAAELNIKHEDAVDKTHTVIEDSTLITILEKRAKIREQLYGFRRHPTQLKPDEPPSECTEAVEESKYSAATDLTDVTIIVDEKRLYFFSDILRRASSRFADKLDEISELGEISLDVGSYNEISTILEFLDPTNEDKSFVNVKTKLPLFWLSLEYDITVLHEACENYLMTNISQLNEHDLTRCILLANRGQCSELMKTAMRETRKYQISAIAATESYKQLDTDTRIQLLKFFLQEIN